jgi:hypothetical protein
VLLVAVALVVAGLVTDTVVGPLWIGAGGAGLVVLAWLAYGVRVRGLMSAGPRGDGPAPPGGAAVREPRRPLPMAPAGAAARPRPEEEPPGRAVAAI